MSGFRQFLLRGSLVDMAVGIVIGAAFSTVVAALVKDLITPLIAAIGGKPDFGGLYFTLNHSKFPYGDFFNALLSFLIVAAVLYFLVVNPYAKVKARFETAPMPQLETRDCPHCLSQIPQQASRCAFCTSELSEAAQPATR
ncbi:MAG: large conductance mechanosensitive channel protein MscL [Candidatus Dormibacteraeota bacterium]|nr:large conductance mechanosensitive channel protein MscL [Candidatus Dormibacteraeota bacterium]